MNSTQSTDLQALLFLVIIAWRLARKLKQRPVRADWHRWRLPLMLTLLGAYETASLAGGEHPVRVTAHDVTYLMVAGAVSVALGAVRGVTVRIAARDGAPTQQYTAITVLLWLATVAVRLGMDAAAVHSFGVAPAVAGTSILMMFGLSLLGESTLVALRAGTLCRGPLARGGRAMVEL